MAQNSLPSGIHDLIWLGVRMLSGRETHGPWLKLGEANDFRAVLKEMLESEAAWATARTHQATAGARNARADEALTSWLAKARLVVMLALGSAWSERWLETGFAQRSTKVPKRLGARMEVARGVIAFLAAHPEYEVPFAQVTAVDGCVIFGELQAAQKAMRDTASVAGLCKKRRDTAEKTLRREMRNTRFLLAATLEPDDARWQAFGLKIPMRNGKPKRSRALPKSATQVIAPIQFSDATPERPAKAVA